MSQISKKMASKEVTDRIFEVFIKSFIKIGNAQDAENLASDLFSPTEKVMLAKRLAIAFLLMKDYEYKVIADLLKVSTSTISSVSLSLNHGQNGYQKILDRISKEDKLEDFFLKTAEKLLSVPASISKGGGAYRTLRADIQKKVYKKSKAF